MGRRSLQASEQGIQAIKKALKRKKWSQTYLAGAVGCSRQTIWSLLQGRPTDCDVLMEICKQLSLTWEEIAAPELSKSEQQNQEIEIDGLVQKVRSHCCEKVQRNHSKIQLLNRKQIDVDHLYVDVYLLEGVSSEVRARIEDLPKNFNFQNERLWLGRRTHQEPQRGFDIAEKHSRLMILGKPGSGKSTFLKHLAFACSKRSFLAGHIPVLITLRDIDESKFRLLNEFQQSSNYQCSLLFNEIQQAFGEIATEQQVKHILQDGKVLLLIDGLDEVSGRFQHQFQSHIRSFSQQYDRNYFIITCRTQTTEYTLECFDYVEIADFDRNKVKTFASKWFDAFSAEEYRKPLTEKFLYKLWSPEYERTSRLAVTPVLLSLVCWVFTCQGNLPSRRSDLYRDGINLLLEDWDKKQGVQRESVSATYGRLSLVDKQKLLSFLALKKFKQSNNFILFPLEEIEEYIADCLEIKLEESKEVLKAIEAHHGLLVERAHDIWSFSHLTFQEYFVARHFFGNVDWKGITKYITTRHWREVFLLLSNMTRPADDLLSEMKQEIDALVSINSDLQEVLKLVDKQLQSIIYPCKKFAIRAFYIDRFTEYTNFTDSLYVSQEADDFANALSCAHITIAFIGYTIGSFDNTLNLESVNALIRDVECALAYAVVCELRQLLQQLIDQLLHLIESNDEISAWWEVHGQHWPRKLKSLISKCWVIDSTLKSTFRSDNELEEALREYCDSNQLLLDCLENACEVSTRVKAEIKDALLLPFAEIEK